MNAKKYLLRMDEYEWGILVNSLVAVRNGLVCDGNDPRSVNEVLLKVIDASKRKSFFRRWCW